MKVETRERIPFSSRRRTLALVLVLVSGMTATVLHPDPALAKGSKWLVAQRKGDEIQALVQELLAMPATKAEAQPTTSVLLDATLLDLKRSEYHVSRNVVIEVVAERAAVETTEARSLPSRARVKFARAFVRRADGSLHRLGDGAVEIHPRSPSGTARIIASFGSLEAGDVVGFSYSYDMRHRLMALDLPLAFDRPLRYGQVMIKMEDVLAYSVLPKNVSHDAVQIDIRERKRGHPTIFVATVHDRAAVAPQPLSLPEAMRIPRLLVHYEGRYYDELTDWLLDIGGEEQGKDYESTRGQMQRTLLDARSHRPGEDDPGVRDRLRRWIYENTWQQIALREQVHFAGLLEVDEEITRTAQRIIDQRDRGEEPSDAIYRFVRDEIATVPGDPLAPPLSPAPEVLVRRSGRGAEKSLLMVALLRSTGISASYVLARDRNLGPVELDRPGVWQFTDLVVLTESNVSGQHHWYLPSDPGCRPGTLPPRLRGTEAFYPYPDLADRNYLLWKKTWSNIGDVQTKAVEWYFQLLKREKWSAFVHTPGDVSELCGFTREILSFESDGGPAEVELSSTGHTQFSALDQEMPGAMDCARTYVAMRTGRAQPRVSSAKRLPSDVDDPSALTMKMEVQLSDLPPTEGGRWEIPAAQIFGKSLLHGWSQDAQEPVFVDATREFHWQCRLPLPPGWMGIEPITALTLQCSRLAYTVMAHVESQQIIIDRRMRLLAGTTSVEDLPEISPTIRAILDFEEQPLVLRAVETGR